MSIGQTFPDVIVLGNDRYQLVTTDAKSWWHCNAPAYDYEDDERVCTINGHNIAEMMAYDGLVVRRRRHPKLPASKRCTAPVVGNTSVSNEYDKHRARFEGMTVEEYRKQRQMFRAYGRFRKHHQRLQQEAAQRRQEALADEKANE